MFYFSLHPLFLFLRDPSLRSRGSAQLDMGCRPRCLGSCAAVPVALSFAAAALFCCSLLKKSFFFPIIFILSWDHLVQELVFNS